MSGTLEKLVRMINQIAQEFEHQQGGDAMKATAEHLRLFWDPRMRQQIVAHLAAGGEGLGVTGRGAVEDLRGG